MWADFNSLGPSKTLVDILRWRAIYQVDSTAFTFLLDGEDKTTTLTYRGLDQKSRAIAATLQSRLKAGECALLLYPPGLEFIAGFFGCLYAGVIAVPAYPPRNNQNMLRLQAIVDDAEAGIVLTTSSIIANLERHFPSANSPAGLELLSTDIIDGELALAWHEPATSINSLAFLQYTSGSTGKPKGVMLTHGNLLHNSEVIKNKHGTTSKSMGMIWLPPYHDMGLIGGIIQPLYAGFPCVSMSPTLFLQSPFRWLRAISQHKATYSGGPNFAYDLCVNKITPEQRSILDLSSWEVAVNGAEPIRAETLERFTATFEPCGFRKEAFYPCYGMAEATLIITGGEKTASPVIRDFDRTTLEQNMVVAATGSERNIQKLVGCGRTWLDEEGIIVDPETRIECPTGHVGEFWTFSQSVAQGYWKKPEETDQTFCAYLANTGKGPFLRTGDLGFVWDGELFITGRLKDLIIIRGRNHYPQDIELTVEESHPALRRGSGAVFSIEAEGEERLVIVQEVERSSIRKLNIDEVVGAIRRAVSEQHELGVYAVQLLKTGSIHKTSSGKIQRHACKAGFLAGTLDVIGEWRQHVGGWPHSFTEKNRGTQRSLQHNSQTLGDIEEWLVVNVAQRLNIAPEAIDIREPFVRYGLDSVAAVGLSGELEEWLERKLSPTLAYDYPTIEAMARHLAEVPGSRETAIANSDDRKNAREPIAIIGMGCRFPGAKNPEEFWRLLRAGVDAITEVPPNRWDVDAFYDPTRGVSGKINTRWGGFLEDVDKFEPEFFGISPREVESMDPQQRLLLEVTWEALENAGQSPEKLVGSQTGVFIGISTNDYSRLQFNTPSETTTYAGTGNAFSIAANRLSYLLDLRGPSLAMDTACSSSLVAVHQSCQSLRQGECSMALAGGVNLILSPALTIVFSQAQMLADDGRCKTFNASADGYVRGEGCGIVVLKRLSDALRDGNTILATIRGSAVNHDGRTNGLTAPNGQSQQEVIREALKNANVAPNQISYVEAHGTGTSLGDPIELNSLKEVLRVNRLPEQTCWIGSVKTNIGHLEAASGIAGLIKLVLSLQNREVPPHLHFMKLNPHISLENTPFSIPIEPQKWIAQEGLRSGGVSSFGFGGTNAHVIVEEAPAVEAKQSVVERPLHLLTISAKSEEALREQAERYAKHLGDHHFPDIGNVCFTAATGRSHFEHRMAVRAGSVAEMREQLAAAASGAEIVGAVCGRASWGKRPKVAFLFGGQGSQYTDMGRQLYETQPAFRKNIDSCDEILKPFLGISLREILHPRPGMNSPIGETAYTQPALFALEYSLAQLWQSWGIEPGAVMGHSLGEYVAACVAGVFTLEDGLKLVAERARLMQALPSGGEMASLRAGEARVARAIELYSGEVSIAAINGPKSVVISGRSEAIQAIITQLKEQGITSKPLKVSHAFHSPLMEPILGEFEAIARTITYSSPTLPVISNVTGKVIGEEITTAEYWCDHIRRPVRFSESIETLREQGYEIFLEVGSKPILLGLGCECLPSGYGAWLPSLREGRPDWEQILESLGQLYVQGVAVDWRGFDRDYARQIAALPTYPFQRKRYWVTVTEQRSKDNFYSQTMARAEVFHPLLQQRLNTPIKIFESTINTKSPAYLAHHRVFQTTVLPASAYVEMALVAGADLFNSHRLVLEDVTIQQALALLDDEEKTIQLILIPENERASIFQIFSYCSSVKNSESSWTLHADGKISVEEENDKLPTLDLATLQAEVTSEIPVDYIYEQYRTCGIEYGSSFQAIKRVWEHQDGALGMIELPDVLVSETNGYILHPVLMDACFQLFGVGLLRQNTIDTYLPVGLTSVHLYRKPEKIIWSNLSMYPVEDLSQQTRIADLELFSPGGHLIAKVKGLKVHGKKYDSIRDHSEESLRNLHYEVEWIVQERQNHKSSSSLAPNLPELQNHLRQRCDQLTSAATTELYQEVLGKVEALSPGYILKAFQEMGWQFQKGHTFSLDEIMRDLGVGARYKKLVNRLLEILTEEGVLRQIEESWETVLIPTFQDPTEQNKSLLALYPMAIGELTLLDRCGSNLARILQGKCDPLQLLFPEGDFTLLTMLYQDSPGAKVMNTLIQEAVIKAMDKLPDDHVLRILEIGGGTGGTTSYILPLLSTKQTEYVFTDISPVFLTEAREKFAGYPFVQYQVLDIEQPPADQGIELHSFDLIIAANVLHATKDLRQTLNHVLQILKPGGILVLLEGTAPQRWLDLIFGLMEGWWNFSDSDLRPSYPLLSVNRWQTFLGEMGFKQTVAVSPDQERKGILSQQAVIVAQSTQARPEKFVSAARKWLIFADRRGVGKQLAALLEFRGDVCTLVSSGKAYKRLSKRKYTIDPSNLAEIERLFKECNELDQPKLHGVVYLWSLDVVSPESLTVADLERISQNGCGSLLHLVQVLIKQKFQKPPSLWVVTQGAQPVGTEPPMTGLAQSPLWGLGKVIALEHPEVKCVLIDLDSDDLLNSAQNLFDEISSEAREDQVAFRKGVRYVSRLVNHKRQESSQQPLLFHEDSTYLITGGLGGLGLQVARWLVDRGARSIVLVGRSQASSDAQTKVSELNHRGAVVKVLQADVSDTEQIKAVFANIEKSLPPLRGVIHAAGILDDGIIQLQSWERFVKVLRPKVGGAWNLHQLTRGMALDFFVMFSSVSSLLGSPGQANHAAANAFLDSLVHYRRAMGLPGLSINWGVWGKVGAAARKNVEEQMLLRGIGIIEPEDGLKIFEQLLSNNTAQIGVVPIEWTRFLRQLPGGVCPSFLSAIACDVKTPNQTEQLFKKRTEIISLITELTPSLRFSFLLDYIKQEVAKTFRVSASQMDEHEPIIDMGLDSLMAFELSNRLKEDLHIDVPMVKFMDRLSITELATMVDQCLSEPDNHESILSRKENPLHIPGDNAGSQTTGDNVLARSASEVLANFDQLSDDEVSVLLQELMMEEEA